jgi:hypothetical protein
MLVRQMKSIDLKQRRRAGCQRLLRRRCGARWTRQ